MNKEDTVEPNNTTPGMPKWAIGLSYVMSGAPVLMMVMGAAMGIAQVPAALEGLVKMGFPPGVLVPVCVVELLCVVLYIIPRTAVLGAILLTGYLGGAVVTHVRVEEGFLFPIFFGVLLWGGLYLRDGRIRALIPLRAPH